MVSRCQIPESASPPDLPKPEFAQNGLEAVDALDRSITYSLFLLPKSASDETAFVTGGLQLDEVGEVPELFWDRADHIQRMINSRQFVEHLARARQERDGDTYSLVIRQTVLFWKVQSHLMAGLKLGLSSIGVPSVAAPVQGSPLMFHVAVDNDACCPSFANTAFSAAAANAKHQPTTL
uniref:Uncharacterized protein n=1 Tax=Oryza rufipogon TaxID=4529 RepID=A0A0E0PE21_ORYRU